MHSTRRVIACLVVLIGLVTAVARIRAEKSKAPAVHAEIMATATQGETQEKPNGGGFRADVGHQFPTPYIDSQVMAAAMAKGANLSPRLSLSHATEYNLRVARGDKDGGAEMHSNETHIIYIIQGDYNYVTGGNIVGAHEISPGQVVGTSIEGGESHHLKKGEILVIPKGTPHWRTEVHGTWIAYLVDLYD